MVTDFSRLNERAGYCTVKLKVALLVTLPEVAVTVMGKVPVGVG